MKTLMRGFAAAEKQGKTVSSVGQLSVGDDIKLRLADGSADCIIQNLTEEK